MTKDEGSERVLAIGVQVEQLFAPLAAPAVIASGECDVCQARHCKQILVLEAFAAEYRPVVKRFGEEVTAVQLARPLVKRDE